MSARHMGQSCRVTYQQAVCIFPSAISPPPDTISTERALRLEIGRSHTPLLDSRRSGVDATERCGERDLKGRWSGLALSQDKELGQG